MADKNGALLFYVICNETHTFVYDRSNKLVDFWQGSGKEISIIPLDEGVRYHIYAGSNAFEYHIGKNKLTEVSTSIKPSSTLLVLGPNSNFTDFIVASRIYKNYGCTQGYFNYSLRGNANGNTGRKIQLIKYEKSRYENQNQTYSEITFDVTTVTQGFNYYLAEMELSPDGKKLAIADNLKLLVFDVNATTGELTSTTPAYTYQFSTTPSNMAVGGIEFISNNELVFSTFDPLVTSSSTDAVHRFDLSANSVTTITSSSDFSRCAIERAKNGSLLFAKSNGLFEMNLGSNTFTAVTTGFNLVRATDMWAFITGNISYYSIFNLPDQIDGQTTEFLDLSETVFTFNLGASFSGSYNWSNASHGFTTKGSGKVLVLNAINITSAASPITMDGMTIEFYDDAVMNISPGSSVTLKGTTLKGSNCGLMWQGIKMMKGAGRLSSTGAQLFMKKNSSGLNTQVLDAHIGVNLYGIRHRLEITEQTLFTANERHLQITEGDKTKIKIWEGNFNGANVLRDQLKGSNAGYNDNKNRTIDGITIIKSNINIGDVTKPNNNIFGGQTGIKAVESTLEITKTNISYVKDKGLWFNANNVANKELKITQSSFYNLLYGMRIEGKTAKTTIQQCSLYNTSAYAIQYIGNQGGKLTIGDKYNAALGNSFNNCNWAAIECFDNGKYVIAPNGPATGTEMIIANNNINNHVYATGVSIGEPGFSNRNYGIMQISKNSIGTTQPIGRGISLRQIMGANNRNPVIRFGIYQYKSDLKVDSNNLIFTTILNNQYSGIYSERVQCLNYLANNITPDPSIIFNTRGNYLKGGYGIVNTDGRFSLINRNTLKGTIGLQVNGNAIFSNYYCNTFNGSINGIQLAEFSILRNNANCTTAHNDDMIHADEYVGGVFGRPNNFNSSVSWGAGIDFRPRTGDYHQWDFVYSRRPIINYFFPRINCGIVHNVTRTNPCENYSGTAVDTLQEFIDITDIQDSVLKWKIKYDIIRDYLSGNTNQQLNEPSILNLISIENHILNENYTAAKTALISYNPTNYIETDYKTVYSIWVDFKLLPQTILEGSNKIQYDTVFLDSANYTIDTLIADTQYTVKYMGEFSDSLALVLEPIARQSAANTNPAAVAARAILWSMKQLQFFDTATAIYPNITGYVSENCVSNSSSGIRVMLMDSSHQFTGIETMTQDSGFFIISGSLLQNLDSNQLYYIAAQLPDSTWVNTDMDKYMDLAFKSYHVLECNSYQAQSLKIGNTGPVKQIRINPNPANEYLNFSNMPQNWKLDIKDISGKIIYSQDGAGNTTLSVVSFTKGLYFVSITNTVTNQSETHKVILD